MRRGDFWLAGLVFVLICSTVFWGNLTVDINLHDTYYVINYATFIIPTVIYFALVAFVYYRLAVRKLSLPDWLFATHIGVSYISTFIYILSNWGHVLALSGAAGRYFSVDSLQPHSGLNLFALNFTAFAVSQAMFFNKVVVLSKKK
jgi:heme/copper-type cytochrome/quinol oxidase subunit 1